jgi:hypothetical protein
LNKDVDLTPFQKEEDEKLIHLVSEKGSKWSEISKSFPGKTDVKLKNRYNLLKRRKFSAESESRDSLTSKSNGPDFIEPFFKNIRIPQMLLIKMIFNSNFQLIKTQLENLNIIFESRVNIALFIFLIFFNFSFLFNLLH